MKDSHIFLPVMIQIILTFWLYIYLAIAKSRALKLGQVDEERRSLHNDAWPDKVLQINNCIRNQFEIPVLFYVLIVLLWLTHGITIYVHILAWMFVSSRIAHAVIHVGSNYVPLRRNVFLFSSLILMAITCIAIFALFTAPNI